MLFVALTRSSILTLFPGDLSRQFRISPNCFLTCATDGFFSWWSLSEDEIAVWESLLSRPGNRRHDGLFVEASFLPALQMLQVSKPSVSGRPVYYSLTSKNEFFLSTHIELLRQAHVWTMPVQNWSQALNYFTVLWPERM